MEEVLLDKNKALLWQICHNRVLFFWSLIRRVLHDVLYLATKDLTKIINGSHSNIPVLLEGVKGAPAKSIVL